MTKKHLLIVLTVSLIVIISGISVVILNRKSKSQNKIDYGVGDVNFGAETKKKIDLELALRAGDIQLGNVGAKVSIIAYDSLSCHHCANFYSEIFPKLKTQYINSGLVNFVHRDFPLDSRALSATKLLKCIQKTGNPASDKLMNIVLAVYASQSDWVASKDFEEKLVKVFSLASLSSEDANKCLTDKRLEDEILESRIRISGALGLNSTPSFFINGKLYNGHLDASGFIGAIESQLSSK